MFTKEQQAQYDRMLPEEMNLPEETVLYMRISAVNTSQVPRYAFFKNPAPSRPLLTASTAPRVWRRIRLAACSLCRS